MHARLHVLDDDPALAAVLEEFRAGRAGIEENMGTVKALMRPPGDPFHERLVASYPHMQAALDHLAANGYQLDPADVARLTPLGHPTINLNGRYRTTSRPPTAGLRPLRVE